jgi:hypothetical protein
VPINHADARFFAVTCLMSVLCIASPLNATGCCDPKSPFREGEGWAETAATCQNIAYWAKRAPITNARVSMSIQGRLSAVEWNGTLAYLEMCQPSGLRVVCVSYATNDMKSGDIVKFGGGLASQSDEWVVLDPCLASRE